MLTSKDVVNPTTIGGGKLGGNLGDTWTLDVYGRPYKDVTISGSYNGQALSPLVIGQTDQAGHFQLSGQMSPDQIGAWVERYAVGGVQWEGALTFQVVPS
jgi:hypothetical protein